MEVLLPNLKKYLNRREYKFGNVKKYSYLCIVDWLIYKAGVAQLVRVSPFQGESYRFESCLPLMKIKKKSKIKKFTNEQVTYLVDILSVYCGQNLGINKRKRKELNYYVVKDVEDCDGAKYYGHYDHKENQITICVKHSKTIKDFVKTFIHEYTHYLQPCRTHYDRLLEIHGYEEHPFEKEAVVNQEKYFKDAYKVVKNLMSQQ